MKIGDLIAYKKNSDKYRGVYVGKCGRQYAVRYTTCDEYIGHDTIYYDSLKHLKNVWMLT